MDTRIPHLAPVKTRSAFWWIVAITLLPAVLGVYFAQLLLSSGIVSPDDPRVSLIATLMLFAAQDLPGGIVFGALVLGAVLIARKTRLSDHFDISRANAQRIVAILALSGAVATWLTARFVFQGYGLSLDEYLPQFQAEIIRHGRLLAPLTPGEMAYHMYLQPIFTYTDEARGLWASQYRPGHAILLALMPSLDGINLLNPVLTALSVWSIANIAHRLWPKRPEMPVLGAVLFLFSPQVLVTAGTGFSYPAHLAFNLIWLALFLKGSYENRMLVHLGAALVGAYAIGLHQVHVHPLFASPFLMLLLLGKIGRRVHLIPYIVLYLIFLPIWVLWPELAVWATTGDLSALPRRLADVNYLADFLRYTDVTDSVEAPFRSLFLAANVLRYLLWLSPAVILFAIVALRTPRRLSSVDWAALASIVLTIVANHILMANQMLTWGARYYHPIIGNMIILALSGYAMLREARDAPFARRLIEAGGLLILASAVVLLPQRMLQVHAKVAPRASVQKAIEAIDADVVVIQRLPIWFQGDFVRNSPFLTNRPLIMALPADVHLPLPEAQPGVLKGARIHVLTVQDLATFGLPRGTLYEPGPTIPQGR
jgi:hypothetical protein